MRLEKRKPSGREKDQVAVKKLEQLRQKLHFGNVASVRRLAAFNLSWMQEDGLEILQEALFGDFPRTTKTAAAYGLRKMHGRMRKPAFETFKKGLDHPDKQTRKVCEKALDLLSSRSKSGKKRKSSHSSRSTQPIQEYRRKPRRNSYRPRHSRRNR